MPCLNSLNTHWHLPNVNTQPYCKRSPSLPLTTNTVCHPATSGKLTLASNLRETRSPHAGLHRALPSAPCVRAVAVTSPSATASRRECLTAVSCRTASRQQPISLCAPSRPRPQTPPSSRPLCGRFRARVHLAGSFDDWRKHEMTYVPASAHSSSSPRCRRAAISTALSSTAAGRSPRRTPICARICLAK